MPLVTWTRTPSDPFLPVFFHPLLHDDANKHAHGLSQTLRSRRVFRCQEVVDRRLQLELANDPGESRPIMMDFRFLHAALPLGVVEKVEDFIKRLLGIIEDIGEGSSLPVAEKFPPCDTHNRGHGYCP